jgi:hypothetical protein
MHREVTGHASIKHLYSADVKVGGVEMTLQSAPVQSEYLQESPIVR